MVVVGARLKLSRPDASVGRFGAALRLENRLDMNGAFWFVEPTPNQKNQKRPNMPMKFLGKILFPHLAPWQRARQAKIMVWVVFITMVLAVVIVAVMFFQNSRR